MDVANSCCNGHGNLNGWSLQAPSVADGTWDTSVVSGEAQCCGCPCSSVPSCIDWWVDAWIWLDAESFNSDHVRSLDDRNEAAADEFQALLWLNIARVEGNNVATDYCWLVVEIGVPEYVVAFLSMLRNEEGLGNTNSTFYLVFLWHFAPCFCPDCLVSNCRKSTLEVLSLVPFQKILQSTFFGYGNSVWANVLRFKFLHVHVTLKFW